jgi:hypothetical protein
MDTHVVGRDQTVGVFIVKVNARLECPRTKADVVNTSYREVQGARSGGVSKVFIVALENNNSVAPIGRAKSCSCIDGSNKITIVYPGGSKQIGISVRSTDIKRLCPDHPKAIDLVSCDHRVISDISIFYHGFALPRHSVTPLSRILRKLMERTGAVLCPCLAVK